LTRSARCFYNDFNMAEPQFDPGGFYEFDLSKGEVRTREGSRVLLLSDNVFGALVSAAVRLGDVSPVRELGRTLGGLVSESLSKDAGDSAPEEVLGHAATVLGLYGWGQLSFERWGDVLVARVDGLPALDPDGLGAAALLGGLFSTLSAMEVACVPVGGERFALVSPQVAEQVWGWARGGDSLAAIVDKLVGGAS